uniref:DNA-directed RNA polymerase n=1 Tax=Dictyopteris divaricata TaxID=156996 RepID=A0A2I4Q2M6_9PHAE|nr:DNA-directed RNA polymerase beta chain [Dictyopteris divaricata]YP_010205267.1 DNA-directed RNA polymerase beta chain [Grateloupia livida]AQZ24976.1 DNA-directed RNA polymerase beta chain [Dictyopteris divaricata]UAV85836.1 DNA-directed RNA polymerase beta chain [Grateloupia livida]
MVQESKIFFNKTINKKELKRILSWAFESFGQRKAAYFIDQLKGLGFEYATNSGISISLEDLRVPPIKKALMQTASQSISLTQAQAKNGEITEVERFQKIIYIWNLTSETLKERLIEFFKKKDPLNSVYIMAFSGARGNIGQVRQLVGMRGLMSDPNGQIIDNAISANFREGLSITDYIISSYGARKGIVDTAIKTADSGYLTRRLVEITQGIIVSELDCKTLRGVVLETKKIIKSNNLLSINEKAIGRILSHQVIKPKTKELIAGINQEITLDLIKIFLDLKIEEIIVRSPLTCECRRAVCQKCYGLNMASGELVELGETIGLIAAQSIGEPGTQLTMRTFHTGGVFTSELARQARANCTGYVRFVPTSSLKPFRTSYGQDAFLSERESYLRILNYSNRIIEVKIDARTIILAKNHSCIKVDDVLFEASPNLNDKKLAQKEIKYISAQESGEIILENKGFPQMLITENFRKRSKNNYIFWVLSGQVFSIPFGSKIKARKFERVIKGQSIAQSKVLTTISGFVHFSLNKKSDGITSIKIQNRFRNLSKFKLFIEKNLSGIEKCKAYLSNQYDISINPEIYANNNFTIGFLNNKKYKTKTGGKFYSFDFPTQEKQEHLIRRRKYRGSTIFYVPQSTVQTICKKKYFNFKNGSYKKKNSEIFPYYITNFSGFISFEGEKTIKTITLKPGRRYFSEDKKINFDKLIERVYFPGELFLECYDIKFLSYLEIDEQIDGIYFYFIPITRYEVTQEKKFKYQFFSNCIFKVEENNFLFKSGENFTTDSPIQFVSYPIVFDYPLNILNTEIIVEIVGPHHKYSCGEVFIGTSQTLLLENLIPKEIKKKGVIVDLLIEDKQFIEAYTTVANLNLLMPWTDYIYSIKTKRNIKNARLLFTTKSDYKSLFFEDFNHCYKKKSLSKVNRVFNNNLLLKESGLFRKISGNYFLFQLAYPYLFSKGAIIRKLPGDFVQKQESLGQLVYERLKTGDIIQGLPKVDEILEVRKPKLEALLATTQGIITNIQLNPQRVFITIKPFLEKNDYDISRSDRLLVKKFQYICVGQPLTEGRINPHTLLQVYFRYFFSLGTLPLYESAYRSIKKLQTLILRSVQTIYLSQGVVIADKHVELIVKEITKKVYVEYPGETNFLPGDIINFDQVNYINKCLHKRDKVLYRPILLGITKSSLKMEGFLAAASFQETTRVLTHAAIEGKIDWLQGLKENAITGRLIPAGTGFYTNQDITYNKVLLPNENKVQSLKNNLNLKEIKLKKIINFKYNRIKN